MSAFSAEWTGSIFGWKKLDDEAKQNLAVSVEAKTVYATDDARYLVMHYRDDVSAFDGVKLANYIDWMKTCYYVTISSHPATGVPRTQKTSASPWATEPVRTAAAAPPAPRTTASTTRGTRSRRPHARLHRRALPLARTDDGGAGRLIRAQGKAVLEAARREA